MPDTKQFTKNIYLDGGDIHLDINIKPDADLEGTFIAWCNDEHEFISVNGWMFE